MVYIQQAMNPALEQHKRGPPHYPRIHVISIREDSLDNLSEPEFQLLWTSSMGPHPQNIDQYCFPFSEENISSCYFQ